MAISRITTWAVNQVLTSTALNNEFNNILNNALALVSPWTANMDAGGFRLITLGAGSVGDPTLQPTGDTNTGIFFSAADTVDVATGGSTAAQFGAAALISAAPQDSRTATVDTLLELRSTTSGTPAADIGTGLLFSAESADESPSNVGQLNFAFSDVTAASEDSYLDVLLRVAGAALETKYRFASTAGAGFQGTFTHAATADRTWTLPDVTGTLAQTSNTLGDFAATTSAQLATVISDETGTGALVFGTSPTLVTPTIAATGWTNANHAHSAANSGGVVSSVGQITAVRKTDAFATTSTTFVDITDLSITITTGARRVLLIFSGSCNNSTNAADTKLTFDIDGTDAGDSSGLISLTAGTTAQAMPSTMVYLTDVLTAASHTFKVNMLVSSSTGNLLGSPDSSFIAYELPF